MMCRHDYVKLKDRHYAMNKHFIIVQGKYRCKKCGKEIYK